MRVRLEDVAREAGVSPKTVSRVLNDEANVTDATRQRDAHVALATALREHGLQDLAAEGLERDRQRSASSYCAAPQCERRNHGAERV